MKQFWQEGVLGIDVGKFKGALLIFAAFLLLRGLLSRFVLSWIRFEGTVGGTVESIWFRSTMVRHFDKVTVMDPDTKLSDTVVINFPAMAHHRIHWAIDVEYRTTVWGEWLEIKEALVYKVKEIVEGAGTGFAFPSQSLYVEHVATERPEVFVPPGNQSNEEIKETSP